MSKNRKYILVLWSNSFDEADAAFFVARLRAAGFMVKLVSISGPRSKGSQGLKFVPDINLSQALLLAERLICIIIPGGQEVMLSLESDPRIRILFEQAQVNPTYFVIRQLGSYPAIESSLLSSAVLSNTLLVYSSYASLIEFVEDLAALLTHTAFSD